MKLLATILLLAAAVPAFAGGLVARDAWIRSAPPGAPLAGYVVLENTGTEAVVLAGASSAAFERVEFHAMSHADGVMRMRKLEEVRIEAGESATFEPGGNHLMLHGPSGPLEPGSEVDIELIDTAGKRTPARFMVRDPRDP